jgi:hypothetical protein
MQSFRKWRKQNRLKYIIWGGLVGVTALTGGIAVYLYRRPETIERVVVDMTLNAFSKALDFDSRKSMYFDLPDPSIMPAAAFEAMAIAALSSNNEKNVSPVEKWAELVLEMSKKLESSFLVQAKAEMRDKLVKETLEFENVKKRLSVLAEILPPSVERNIVLEDQLTLELEKRGGWLNADLLESNSSQDDAETCDLGTKLVIMAISFFPGPINGLIAMLQGKIACDAFASSISKSEDAKKVLANSMSTLQKSFCALHPRVRSHVLNAALTHTIDMLPRLGKINSGGITPYVFSSFVLFCLRVRAFFISPPSLSLSLSSHTHTHTRARVFASIRSTHSIYTNRYDLYVRTIDQDLIRPLGRDARINENILDQVRRVFLALPSHIQARVLLTAMDHTSSVGQSDMNPEEQAALVRDLLSSGGVVSIKLAQMLAEEAKVPIYYRRLLGGLRESNEPMHVSFFWHGIPKSVRRHIKKLGQCIGMFNFSSLSL